MEKISRLEKLIVNVLSPLDLLSNRLALCFGDIQQEKSWRYIVRQKNVAYERLLRGLEFGYNENLVYDYMTSPCGRIQARLAVQRGLIAKLDYSRLKKETFVFDDFSGPDKFRMM